MTKVRMVESINAFKNRLIPYLFAAPSMILLITFGIFPILVAAFVSLTDMNISGLADRSNVKFIGLANYSKLLADHDFWQSVSNTAIFAVIGIPSVVLLSLGIALLLNRSSNLFFRSLRAFYFVPAITAIVAISLIWGYLYNTQFGFLNWLLSLVHIHPIQWLSNPILATLSTLTDFLC